MSAAHVRRGGAARTRAKKPSKVAVPKKIAKRLPVDQARANKVAGLEATHCGHSGAVRYPAHGSVVYLAFARNGD